LNFIPQQAGAAIENYELEESSSPLPILPYHLIRGMIERLNGAEVEELLRYKILPVAHLPNLILYGAAGEIGNERARTLNLRVVARIAPQDFQRAIKECLSHVVLNQATFGLKSGRPDYSAHERLTYQQYVWAGILLSWLTVACIILPLDLIFALASLLFGVFFLSVIAVRLMGLIYVSNRRPPRLKKLHESELPVYTVLVPVFRETGVLHQLITALTKLRYPSAKLDIKIIAEEKDAGMRLALQGLDLPPHFEVIIVPQGKPQTKPRALNYALQFARGSLLTIFDAEDVPERNQLRMAAEKFAAADESLACLQAELTFYNPSENWLTRQFTIEYAMLFKLALPSLAQEKLPLLLGGTSNHFRTKILRDIGAWDPFNVTEDADLGMRLARLGYQTSVLESTTYEEANVAFWNWLHQRSRWLKGFLQTWFVHMRNPISLFRKTGFVGFWIFQANTIGIFVSALFMPLMIGHTLYQLMTQDFCFSLHDPTEQFICVLNMFVFFLGYGISIAAGWRAIRLKKIDGWWRELATLPVYWLMMTLAAWKATWQFIVAPFHWNKTEHGLSAFQKAHEPK
jgi:cellulose synthase/poly-beta-1,6-N-acetylglucosamine synthase-like glycosyltransferase